MLKIVKLNCWNEAIILKWTITHKHRAEVWSVESPDVKIIRFHSKWVKVRFSSFGFFPSHLTTSSLSTVCTASLSESLILTTLCWRHRPQASWGSDLSWLSCTDPPALQRLRRNSFLQSNSSQDVHVVRVFSVPEATSLSSTCCLLTDTESLFLIWEQRGKQQENATCSSAAKH